MSGFAMSALQLRRFKIVGYRWNPIGRNTCLTERVRKRTGSTEHNIQDWDKHMATNSRRQDAEE
jgi:hypothetical protein